MIYLNLFIVMVVGLIITPVIIKLSYKYDLVDKPSERKVHKKSVPRLGGISIVVSFFTGALLFKVWDIPTNLNLNFVLILVGIAVIVFLGLLDDIFTLGAKVKFLVQILASLIVVAGGIKLEFINLPLIGLENFSLGFLSIPISMLWIVGITNAINLIDGLDGLSSGISIISLFTLVSISFIMGDKLVLMLCLILIFSITGFFKYNFFPAKIFMGDVGSLFLGFMISIITLVSYKSATLISLLIPLFVLAIPVLDTLLAIVRRIINKKPIGVADKNHLHHCLMDDGMSHRETVLIIYLFSLLFNVFGLMLIFNNLWITLVVLLLTFISFIILILKTDILVNKSGLSNEPYKCYK